jgi:hypothetical protein
MARESLRSLQSSTDQSVSLRIIGDKPKNVDFYIYKGKLALKLTDRLNHVKKRVS